MQNSALFSSFLLKGKLWNNYFIFFLCVFRRRGTYKTQLMVHSAFCSLTDECHLISLHPDSLSNIMLTSISVTTELKAITITPPADHVSAVFSSSDYMNYSKMSKTKEDYDRIALHVFISYFLQY